MRVCQACRRKYRKGIRLHNKLICSWCEQSLISLDANDHGYDGWVNILKRDTVE